MSVTPEMVRQALNSEDLGDRLRAVNHLRELEPGVAFELAQTAIADANARVRYAAVSQLSSLGAQDRDTAATILRDRLLHDTEPDVQAAAADSIGGLKLREAFPELQQVYHGTSEWLLQFSIVAALGELGDARGFELLREALASDEGLLQLAAIGSLGELGNPQAVDLLIPYATSPDWQVRHRLAQALGRLGGEEARRILTQLSEDEMPEVAQAAATQLQST
jgi:HEAT repeat protein